MVDAETLLVAAISGLVGAFIYALVTELAGPPLRRLAQRFASYPLHAPRGFGTGASFSPYGLNFLLHLENRTPKSLQIDRVLLLAKHGLRSGTISNPLPLDIIREARAGGKVIAGEWWQLREDGVVPPYSIVMFGVGSSEPGWMVSRIGEAKRLRFVVMGKGGEVLWKCSTETGWLRRSLQEVIARDSDTRAGTAPKEGETDEGRD
jgi:hypothetical protein